MNKTFKSQRLYISILGKCNCGKSSLINALTGHDISIVSDVSGTTADVVEKSIELNEPIGPVVFADTAGVDDIYNNLGQLRVERSLNILKKSDLGIIVCDSNGWDEFEIELFEKLNKQHSKVVAFVNKQDESKISEDKLNKIRKYIKNEKNIFLLSAKTDKDLQKKIYTAILSVFDKSYFTSKQTTVSDIIKEDQTVILVTPIDKEAPKGRLIVPQVQVLRDILDLNSYCIIVKETQLKKALQDLKKEPDLVICDSQVFKFVAETIPENIPMTSFSILLANLKGDLKEFIKGVKSVENLDKNAKILIYESCAHHAIEDDIARIKIPKWLKNKTGKSFQFSYFSGSGFEKNIDKFDLVIQCGGCMTNSQEILSRIDQARQANIPITNYGIIIAYCLNILPRAIEPFNI